jgi:hypothetical protein
MSQGHTFARILLKKREMYTNLKLIVFYFFHFVSDYSRQNGNRALLRRFHRIILIRVDFSFEELPNRIPVRCLTFDNFMSLTAISSAVIKRLYEQDSYYTNFKYKEQKSPSKNYSHNEEYTLFLFAVFILPT